MNDSNQNVKNGVSKTENSTNTKLSSNMIIEIPEKPIQCKWDPNGDPKKSPHTKVDWHRTQKLLPNAIAAVGQTPLVKLNKIPATFGVECDVYAKCEYFNPGGSIKDRMAFRMIEDAEKAGILKPGSTIIEPTSGNTGIGLALGAAVKGYRCIIVISEKMSDEKIAVLRALGAEIVRTPITADSRAPDGQFGVTKRLNDEIPNSVVLNQYKNSGNALAHYDTTAEEIIDQCGKKLDMIVIGAGTGGTITGIGRRFKEAMPKTTIVGVDPDGSVLAEPIELNRTDVTYYEIEGIGYDFIPTSIDRRVVDRWVKVTDQEAFVMARRLIREEGLLSGGSSGAIVAGAMKIAAELRKGQRMVVILPDSIRNYLTKFVEDQWMEARGFIESPNPKGLWWWNESVTKLRGVGEVVFVTREMTCHRALHMMKKQKVDVVAVVDKDGGVLGTITQPRLINALIHQRISPNDLVVKVLVTVFPKLTVQATLGVLARVLDTEPYVLIVDKSDSAVKPVERPTAVLTSNDLLTFISAAQPQESGVTGAAI